ncbi:MAG: transposase [Candidatus Kaiserbacteria bacterium]|nr:transposase [Candidatus Kaiserbacteria bacterium]
MRVEPFSVGSVIHVTNRGARGTDIVRDFGDKHRFVKSLFLLNDTHTDSYWHQETARLPLFERPSHWPEREPLVHILAWTLLSNHFHLLIQEVRDGGTAKFMQRFGGSLSMCFNLKYKERGSLFQSSYHAREVSENSHLNYLVFYILVKNVLEMYPGGLVAAYDNFDHAWEWASQYRFSSFKDHISGVPSLLTDDSDELLTDLLREGDSSKQEMKELLALHMSSRGAEFKKIALEPW